MVRNWSGSVSYVTKKFLELKLRRREKRNTVMNWKCDFSNETKKIVSVWRAACSLTQGTNEPTVGQGYHASSDPCFSGGANWSSVRGSTLEFTKGQGDVVSISFDNQV